MENKNRFFYRNFSPPKQGDQKKTPRFAVCRLGSSKDSSLSCPPDKISTHKMITRTQAIAVLAVVLTIAAAGMGSVYADTEAAEKNNPMSGLVAAIASKFNLDAGQVQLVFDEQKTKMETRREQNFKDRLSEAVADSKITQDQADTMISKLASLEASRTAMRGLTDEERKTAIKAQVDDLKLWAKDNNIPARYLMMGGRGFSGRPGPGLGRFHDSPTTTSGTNTSK